MTDKIGHIIVTFIAGVVTGGLLINYLKPDPHAWMLVGVMMTGGLLGGGVNYFLSKADDPQNTTVTRSLFIGIGAALLVPLFLNMLSSDLLKSSRNDPLAILVFLGFCLIAAISSKAFITTLSERILRQVKEAKEDAAEAREDALEAKKETAHVKSEIAPLVSRETEAESEAGDTRNEFMVESAEVRLNEYEKNVLRALGRARYAFRSFSGLSRDTDLTGGGLREVLDSLIEHGLAGMKKGRDGTPRWYITEEGRSALITYETTRTE